MSRTAWVIVALMGLTTVSGVGIWLWPRQESAELREVKQLQTEMQQTMFTPAAERKELSAEQRRAKFDELRQKMESLPEEDRKQADKAMRQGMARQMEQKIARFFALPPEEQTAALDAEIDEQEARRKAWGGGGPFGPPPGGTPSGGGPSTRASGGVAGASAAAGPGPNAAPSAAGNNGDGRAVNRPFGPPRNFQNMSADDRKRMQRDMLDSTTPEFRARMSEYIKKVQTRRQDRGLPNFGPPG